MRLILIRHGDPDYVRDSLTEKGWREAALLAERAKHWKVDGAYESPLGRARDTASGCLKAWGMQENILPWLCEFFFEDAEEKGFPPFPWDFFPADWTGCDANFCENRWVDEPSLCYAREKYRSTCASLDELVKNYGYERTGRYYRALSPTDKTVVFFCHFGISMILLSHLLNISAEALLHGVFLPPSSVTVLNTEERRGKEAYFRIERLGDCAHLIAGGETISESGYFTKIMQEPPIGRK